MSGWPVGVTFLTQSMKHMHQARVQPLTQHLVSPQRKRRESASSSSSVKKAKKP